MKKILLSLLMFLPLLASADAVDVDGIRYVLNNPAEAEASVTSLLDNKYSGDIVIPESITYDGVTYRVTFIKDGAFYECTGLTSITIPNSVTSIGHSAFYKCSGLTALTIPNSVTTIGNGAFSTCDGLTSIEIPQSITNISDYAFAYCRGLISMTIPNSVISIGSGAFSDCSSLTTITIPNSVSSIGGGAFWGCSSLTSITIPSGVTSLGASVFEGCSSLSSINIPEGVTSIGMCAFCQCSSLTSVNIPNSVNYIGENAFTGSSLKSIVIPNGVTSISDYAFSECFQLTSVTIPNSVTSIGIAAFLACYSLTSITIPNSVTYIGNVAFEFSGLKSITIPNGVTTICNGTFCMSDLQSITIPSSVTSIGERAFYKSRLESITIPSSVTTIGKDAFSLSPIHTVHITDVAAWCNITFENSYANPLTNVFSNLFLNDEVIEELVIPDGVKEIKNYAFYDINNTALKISIPRSVTTIGDSAFFHSLYSNSNITDFYCYAKNAPITGSGTFNCMQDIILHVPKSSAKNYRSVEPWNQFKRIVELEGLIEEKYKLTYMVDGEVYKTYELSEGDDITPEDAPTKEGYTFSGWSDIPSKMPAKDVTVTGTFTKNEEQQQEITKEDVVYEVEGGTVTVTQSDNATGAVKIEASVEISGKTYEVTVIAKEAFKESTGMTAVDIPNSITSIGEKAFEGCTGLRLIEIGKGIKEIASKAFANIFKSNARTRGGDDGLQVYCEADAVPNTASDAFDGTDISHATLHVPESLIDTYKVTAPWKGFGTIVGLSTGIKTISIDQSDVLIFDMQGNRLNNLRKGLNIIRTKDGKTKKIVVK